jgi:hypothetical protein
MFPPTFDCVTSSKGACPVTVTDSCTEDGDSCRFATAWPHAKLQPASHRREASQFSGDSVEPGAQRQPIAAVLIGHGNKGVARCLVDGGDRHAGQDRIGGISHVSRETGFLCVADDRDAQADDEDNDAAYEGGRHGPS